MGLNNDGEVNSIKILKIHFFYVSFILSGLIVLVATTAWTKIEGFTNYIGVAATITSLVLGILAIIYSFVSSGSTNQFLGSIESSANSIREIGGKLGEVFESGQELQAKAQARNEELHVIIENLRSVIDLVSNRTVEIAGAVETIPNHLIEIRQQMIILQNEGGQRVSEMPVSEAALSEEVPSEKVPSEKVPSEKVPSEVVTSEAVISAAVTSETVTVDIPKDLIAEFVRKTSTTGILIYKGLADAKLRDRYCDLKKSFRGNVEYVYGFLTAVRNAGLADIEFSNSKKSILKDAKVRLKFVSESLADSISVELSRRQLKMDEGEIKYLNSLLDRIYESTLSFSEIENLEAKLDKETDAI